MELYDLESDVGETKNLADDYPQIAERLLARTEAFQWPETLIVPRIGLPRPKKLQQPIQERQ